MIRTLFFVGDAGFFFMLGLLVGRRIALRGSVMPKRLLHPVRFWRSLDVRGRWLAVLAVAMLVTAGWQMWNSYLLADARQKQAALVACQYRATAATLAFQENFRDQIKAPQAQTPKEQKQARDQFVASLDAHISALKLLQAARGSDDPAAVCERGKP